MRSQRGYGDQRLTGAIIAYSNAAKTSISDLWMDTVPCALQWGLEQLFSATRNLDHAALLNLTAQVKLTKPAERDEFQQTFLKLQPQLTELRKLRCKPSFGLRISGDNKAEHLQSLSQFSDSILDHEVTINDESLWPSGKCTLREYLSLEQLHLELTLLIHGPTGLGKSEMAKVLFYTVSCQYLGDAACLWYMNTVDSLRKIQSQLIPGHVILLDEMDPESVQLVHCDMNLLKACTETKWLGMGGICKPNLPGQYSLTSPMPPVPPPLSRLHSQPQLFYGLLEVLLNPVTPGTLRTRNEDVTVPARTIRVLTSNCSSVAEWLGGAGHQGDRDAVTRRLAMLHVTDSLWKTPGSNRIFMRQRMLPRRLTFDQALTHAQSGL